jgi:MoxR-like ATPase
MSTDNLNPEEVNQPDESDQPNAENTGAAASEEHTEEILATPARKAMITPKAEVNPLQGALNELVDQLNKVRGEIKKLVIGQDDMIDLLLISILAGGHAMVEGVPGIAKTLTTRLLAKTLNVDFSRIQFTPDLMPADVIGTNVFNMKESDFRFNRGPIFSNVVLIDEINRAPAKTQSALFEVMEEYQVTVDGETYIMDQPFFVLATQNPLEQEGTYKLPEAQLDRFLFRILIDYPNLEEELQILDRFRNDFNRLQEQHVEAVLTAEQIADYRKLVENISIEDGLLKYIAQVILETRENPDLYLGASPRASLAIMKAAKANAALNGRFFVTPDDVKRVAFAVLNHRIMLTPEREMEGVDARQVIDEILNKIEIPR